jgi:lysophospholipase L1-like esterase
LSGHRRLTTVALAAVLALLGLFGSAAARPADDDLSYVALGDSFAAGPFIPLPQGRPSGCVRSTGNYPTLLAEALDAAEFTDVSCSGAVIANLTTAQRVVLGSNPPQFEALRPDTDLVTVSIGGNDIGFLDMVLTCGRLSFSDPLGAPCRQQATAGGTDHYAERVLVTAPKLAAALRGIRERSPDATVMLVSYLRMLPPTGGCWPLVPIARGDVPYLDGIHQQLNAMLAEQAQANGALFVDSYAISLGHDMCQLPGMKWVEGVIPTQPASPVHPNARGMQAVAELALDTLTTSFRD